MHIAVSQVHLHQNLGIRRSGCHSSKTSRRFTSAISTNDVPVNVRGCCKTKQILSVFRVLEFGNVTEVGQLHPVHESFLHFYIAICNESLGLAAHRFSSKKLSYLHRAKDAFTASSVSLPLPYDLDDTGDSEAILPISQSSQVDHFDPIDDERSGVFRSAKFDIFPSSCAIPDIKQSLHERCDSGYDSASEPRSADSDKIPDFKRYSARQPFKSLISDEEFESRSSSHAQDTTNINLNDGKLMPKPLFIQKRTSDLNQSSSSASDQLLPTTAEPLYLSQCTTAIIPSSPNGKITLVPTTRTTSSSPTTTPTPPPGNQQPSTYNTNLQTFYHLLLNHLATINHTITTTTHLQNEHTLNKTKRLASFWSFKPVLANKANGANDDDDEEEEDVKAREKKERIELLRREGWRVNKEKFGWKGEAFYEALSGVALGELS